jgi:hypothetical protein
LSETKFDKDKEVLSNYRSLLAIYMALIISISGGLSAILLNDKLVFTTRTIFVIGIGLGALMLFFSLFISNLISLFKLLNKLK